MKQINYTRVEDFLRDDDFIRYVMDAGTEESYWTSCLSAAPHVRSAYLKAYDILTHLDDCHLLTAEQVQLLRQRIERSCRLSVN
ncbi:MAG: hypothetical protein ILA25_04570 [Prevotella sp.]|nr:hypothetical protein [Prevotella sp.]